MIDGIERDDAVRELRERHADQCSGRREDDLQQQDVFADVRRLARVCQWAAEQTLAANVHDVAAYVGQLETPGDRSKARDAP